MNSYTLAEAADICGTSVKALRRRAERGTLRVVVRDGVRRVPEMELERVGLLPDVEVRSLKEEIARLEKELSSGRLLVERVERQATVESKARANAEAALVQAVAAEKQARAQLEQLAQMGWLGRRRWLREARANRPLPLPLPSE